MGAHRQGTGIFLGLSLTKGKHVAVCLVCVALTSAIREGGGGGEKKEGPIQAGSEMHLCSLTVMYVVAVTGLSVSQPSLLLRW